MFIMHKYLSQHHSSKLKLPCLEERISLQKLLTNVSCIPTHKRRQVLLKGALPLIERQRDQQETQGTRLLNPTTEHYDNRRHIHVDMKHEGTLTAAPDNNIARFQLIKFPNSQATICGMKDVL